MEGAERVTSESRSGLIYLAKLAEQAERFDDMKFYMQKIALMVEPETEGGPPQRLSRDERSYLSVAYKNVVGMRRAAWRVLNAPEKLDVATEVAMQSQLQNYARVVESELNMLCDEVIELVSTVLIANATETEELVFYQKMAGDYFRYKAEFLRDDPRDAAVAGSKKWYSAALTQAGGLEGKSALASTDPIRLGLILNYSVFMYEIQGDHSAACDVAKKGFDDAVEDLESLEEEAYKDATLIMQLLRDNLSLWTTKDEE